MKKFLCIIMLLIGLRLHAQDRQILPTAAQCWRELNLTKAQKEQIRLIILRIRLQKQQEKDALDKILTPEQKKKLREWQSKKKNSK